MRSPRELVSHRLLEFGTTLAFDREEMLRNAQRAGVRSLSRADRDLLGVLDLWSSVAIRLGLLMMPAQASARPRGAPSADP